MKYLPLLFTLAVLVTAATAYCSDLSTKEDCLANCFCTWSSAAKGSCGFRCDTGCERHAHLLCDGPMAVVALVAALVAFGCGWLILTIVGLVLMCLGLTALSIPVLIWHLVVDCLGMRKAIILCTALGTIAVAGAVVAGVAVAGWLYGSLVISALF